MLGRSFLIAGLSAVALAGCATTSGTQPSTGEIVTVQYDPNAYDQVRTVAAATKQCRAKGYANAVPHSQQPTTRQGWGYQTFVCIG